MALLLFLAKTIQKSFFLTFTRAENNALKFRTQTSTIFCKKSNLWFIFGFALKRWAQGLKN